MHFPRRPHAVGPSFNTSMPSLHPNMHLSIHCSNSVPGAPTEPPKCTFQGLLNAFGPSLQNCCSIQRHPHIRSSCKVCPDSATTHKLIKLSSRSCAQTFRGLLFSKSGVQCRAWTTHLQLCQLLVPCTVSLRCRDWFCFLGKSSRYSNLCRPRPIPGVDASSLKLCQHPET